MSFLRQKKINELIRRELSQIIVREFDAEDSLVTILNVDVSADLLSAKVSVSVFPANQANKVFGSLRKMTGLFQKLLNRRLKMKTIPYISFYLIKNE